MSSSSDASAASNTYPSDSRTLRRSDSAAAARESSSRPNSAAFIDMPARPPRSETSTRVRLPDVGRIDVLVAGTSRRGPRAEVCSPPLWAKADDPT